jgi:hypothetical protein
MIGKKEAAALNPRTKGKLTKNLPQSKKATA